MAEKKRRCGRLALEGDLTLRHIEPARSRLLDLLARHAAVIVDCEAVTGADLGLIQLLLAARKSAEAAGKTLTLARPASGVLREALSRGGFLGDGRQQDSFWLTGGAAS